ncbi:MAG: hypothetical protein ACK5SH_09270, partial [Pseudomonadota bacterium]
MTRLAVAPAAAALVALLAACAGTPPTTPVPPSDPRASADAFAGWIGLSAEGSRREFFVGDHRDGYYSGM